VDLGMARLHLRIEPDFLCDVASIGTVDHIRVLRRALGIKLGEAKSYVDRCVFDRETVIIEMASRAMADALARELAALPGPARVKVTVED
jgi:hypothetical protein